MLYGDDILNKAISLGLIIMPLNVTNVSSLSVGEKKKLSKQLLLKLKTIQKSTTLQHQLDLRMDTTRSIIIILYAIITSALGFVESVMYANKYNNIISSILLFIGVLLVIVFMIWLYFYDLKMYRCYVEQGTKMVNELYMLTNNQMATM